MAGKIWSEREEQILKDVYSSQTAKKIIHLLSNRTWNAIKQRARNIGVKRIKVWSIQEKNMKLNSIVEQILIGSMCGDGGISKSKANRNARFNEAHNIKEKDYLLWKKRKLGQQFIMREYKRTYMYEGEKCNTIMIYSLVHPILTELHKIFYPTSKGHKIMPYVLLEKLNALGLAIWYMDDGNKWYNYCCIAIHKQNVKNIIKFFRKKLNMRVSVDRDKRSNKAYVRLNVTDTQRFFSIISPYIHFSMRYKIETTDKERKHYKEMYSEASKRYRERKKESLKK